MRANPINGKVNEQPRQVNLLAVRIFLHNPFLTQCRCLAVLHLEPRVRDSKLLLAAVRRIIDFRHRDGSEILPPLLNGENLNV
jgi:hypothetical protein